MEENTNSTIPFYFPKEYKSIVSIIGIGGGAGRIVNEMQVYEFLKRYLYVFDMNRKEMEELSLPHKYLIGTDELVHIPADTRSAFPVISVQSPVSIQYRWQS